MPARQPVDAALGEPPEGFEPDDSFDDDLRYWLHHEVVADSGSPTGLLRPVDVPRGLAALRGEFAQRAAHERRRRYTPKLGVYRESQRRRSVTVPRGLCVDVVGPLPNWLVGALRESEPHGPPLALVAGAMSGPSAAGASLLTAA